MSPRIKKIILPNIINLKTSTLEKKRKRKTVLT